MHRYHFRLRRCRILAVPCGPSLYALVQGGRAVSTPSASPLRFDFDRRQHRAPGRKEEEPQPQRQSRLSRSTEVLLDACDGERHLAQQSPLSPVTSHHDSTIANVAHERAPGLLHGEQRCTARSKVASPPPFEGARYTRRQARQRGPAISAAMLMRSLQERNSPYVATLRKRVVPRHTGTHGAVEDRNSAHQSKAQRLAEADLRSEEARSMKRDGYDPALVVHIDSRRRQVRLNDVQRELIWTARQEQYHRLLQRVVACLQSHRSPIEKCQTLYGLHDEVIEKHMRLRADTYEDMLHTLYSVGVQRGGGAGQPGKGSLSLSAGPVSGGAVWEDCSWKEDLPLGVGGALPAELARPLAASSTVLSPHGIEKVWEMYRYLVDSGTDPTPRILQYVMGLLEHASVSLAVARSHSAANSGGIPATPGRRGARSSGLLLVEAKAHSLMMDADRFHLAPTEYTVNSYIAICEACDVMHLAVARVTDYQTRQERQASPGMYARLLTGLVRCGHYTDAMAVVTTMQNVAMTTYLVNAVLQAARYSRDPASVFTFYRALFFVPSNPLRVGRDRHTERGSSAGKAPSLGRASPTSRSATGLAPSLATFSIMAEVMLQTQDYTELTFLVAEMRHYGVRGNGLLLNKLLKMMHIAGRPPSEVRALQSAMDAKQVRVFDENRSGGHAPSLQQDMQWTDVEQEQLNRFLEGFSCPDPAVQASHLEQLQALSQHPSALVSTLAVVCDAAAASTVRLSATTVARQLLRCVDRLPLYLSAAGSDPATVAQSIAEALFNAALEGASSLSSEATAAPLQRSTGSLITCLLRSLAGTRLAAIAPAVWSRTLSSLLHLTSPATLVVKDASEDGRQHTAQFGARCAALLRELCEDFLSTSTVLHEWVGGQAAESLALCSLFSQLLQLLERQMEAEHAASGAAARALAVWLEETLAAFQVCIDSGLLPCGPSTLSRAPTGGRLVTSPGADSGGSTRSCEGPSAQGLRAVCTAVAGVQNTAQGLILRRILRRLELLDHQSLDGAYLREAVVSVAPFVAVSMRYMADAVALDGMETLHSAFSATATPLLASFCHAVCLAELQYDGAGESGSVHAAVLACVDYLAEWMSTECARPEAPSICLPAFLTNPSTVSARTEDYISCLFSVLVDAATLPPSVAGTLEEHTTHQPDSAAQLLVKPAPGRRRGRRSGYAQKTNDGWASTVSEPGEEAGNASPVTAAMKRDDEDDTLLADSLEAALPDSGTLRQAVVWCAVVFSCEKEWVVAAAPLVMRLSTMAPLSSLAAACSVESVLFVQNEFLDGILADNVVSASLAVAAPELLERHLEAQVQSILSLLSPLMQDGLGARTPFFVRIQAVRYLGRLTVGLLGAWQHTFSADHPTPDDARLVARTHTVMRAIGGLEGLITLALGCLTTEVSKATQMECIKALCSILASCLSVMEQLMHSSADGSDASDLEEESLDSASSSSGDVRAGDGGGDVAGRRLHSDPGERLCALCQAFGATTDLRAIVEVLRAVSAHLPSFQWRVRQAVCHLFSEVLPSLWRAAPLVDSFFACRTDGTHSVALHSVRGVTTQVLEALAQHYTSLLRSSPTCDSSSTTLEMATLLTTMADVTSAMDGGALEVVVPWVLQVAHHMLHLYADYLTPRAHSSNSLTDLQSAGGVLDMTDMCMVSLDLVSSICDGVIDRDALLEQQLRPKEASGARGAFDARMMAFATSLLLPLSSGVIECGIERGAEALPNRCMALLSMCQSLSDHPAHVSAKPNSLPADAPAEDGALCLVDEFGEVRRACFAILYDCVFLAAYPSSLFRPCRGAAGPGTELLSIPGYLSDALGRELSVLCMREVLPSIPPLFATQSAELQAHFRFVSAHNVAASDAWLCLGSLLSLWDQQHWQTSRRRPNGARPTGECDRGPGAVFCAPGLEFSLELHSHCLHTLNELLALLQDKRATVMPNMRLNMTTAACGLAVLLCYPGRLYTESGAQAPVCPLPFSTVSTTFSVASSARVQEYAADAPRGDLRGIHEAAHVLWCLGRLWQEAVQPLPHDVLRAFLHAHGKEVAKTIVWWTRWAFGAKQRLTPAAPHTPASAPFWGSLLELWRPVVRTLVQAAQGKVLALTQSELSTLSQLERR